MQQCDIWTPTPEEDVSVNVVYREQLSPLMLEKKTTFYFLSLYSS